MPQRHERAHGRGAYDVIQCQVGVAQHLPPNDAAVLDLVLALASASASAGSSRSRERKRTGRGRGGMTGGGGAGSRKQERLMWG